MSTFTKDKLSASTNGKNIKVVATATAGTLIHTAVTGTTNWDEVYLFASNNDTVTRTLTIEWGGVASPDDLIKIDLEPLKGEYIVIVGRILQNGLLIRAFASAANVVVVGGYVHHIVP